MESNVIVLSNEQLKAEIAKAVPFAKVDPAAISISNQENEEDGSFSNWCDGFLVHKLANGAEIYSTFYIDMRYEVENNQVKNLRAYTDADNFSIRPEGDVELQDKTINTDEIDGWLEQVGQCFDSMKPDQEQIDLVVPEIIKALNKSLAGT